MNDSSETRRLWGERPFGRYFRDLCQRRGLKTGQIAAMAARQKIPNLAKSTLDDLFSGKTWTPTDGSILSLIQVLKLDDDEQKALQDAVNAASDAKAAARRKASADSVSASGPAPEQSSVVRDNGRPAKVRTWVLAGVLLAVAGAIVAGLLWFERTPPVPVTVLGPAPESPRATGIQFTDPVSRESVGNRFLARGTGSVPDGMTLWLVVQPPDGAFYLNNDNRPVMVDGDSTWWARVSLGRSAKDVGSICELYAVLTSADDSSFAAALDAKRSSDRSVRWGTLPGDATVVARVRVRMTSFN